jgi:hypothetical protein
MDVSNMDGSYVIITEEGNIYFRDNYNDCAAIDTNTNDYIDGNLIYLVLHDYESINPNDKNKVKINTKDINSIFREVYNIYSNRMELLESERKLVKEGKYVTCIKELRGRLKLDLKAAKELVDNYRAVLRS